MVSNNYLELLGKFSNCVHANLPRPYLDTCNPKSTTFKRIVLNINQGKFEEMCIYDDLTLVLQLP